jgi:DNA recombination protein RmuC
MDLSNLLFFILIIAVFAIFFFLLFTMLNKSIHDRLSETSRTFLELTRTLTESINNTQSSMDQRLEAASKTMLEVQRQLGTVNEAVKRVFDVGQDIASLHEILRAPKIRGGMGELFLEDLLSQILPRQFFSLQHSFKSGEKVDAVIRAGEKMVPIDAKFPLENFKRFLSESESVSKEKYHKEFRRDIKKHIESIASKYIKPAEGTYDFALMYIPAENVYYETIIKSEDVGDENSLFHFSARHKVIPVSPNSFYAYLQVILYGLRGMQVEEKAKEILAGLSGLNTEYIRLQEDFLILGKHINNAHGSFDKASQKLEKFGYSLSGMSEIEKGQEKTLDS